MTRSPNPARHRARRQLVDGVRARARRVRSHHRRFPVLPRPGPPHQREAPRTRPDRAGFTVGSQFVFSQHCKAMRDVGFSDEQVAAIPAWSVADCWSPVERAVLAYTDCLVLQLGRVPNSLFNELQTPPVRRGDPRVHLHHLHLCDACHDEPGAAARVRRRRRSSGRGRRPVGPDVRPRRDGGVDDDRRRGDDTHRRRGDDVRRAREPRRRHRIRVSKTSMAVTSAVDDPVDYSAAADTAPAAARPDLLRSRAGR